MKSLNKENLINIKNKTLSTLDLRNYNLTKRIRIISLILIVGLIVGLFFPLISTSINFSVGDTSSEKHFDIISEENNLYEVSVKDLIFRKPLSEHKIYDKEIGDIKVFDVSIYELLTTYIPDFTILEDVNKAINGDWVKWLTDPELTEFISSTFGDTGKQIVDFAATISDTIENLKGTMATVVQVSEQISEVSDTIKDVNNEILYYKGIVETVVTIIISIILLAMIIFAIGKGPKYLPAIMLSIGVVIFAALGIGVTATNSALYNTITPSVDQLNSTLTSMLNTAVPGANMLISVLLGTNVFKFQLGAQVFVGAGYWILFSTLIIMTAVAYFVPIYTSRKKISE